MEITIRLDGSEDTPQLLRIADAIKTLAGEKATSTIELKMDGSALKKALDETLATFNRDELAADEALPPLAAGPVPSVEFGKQPLPAEAENHLGMPGAPSLPLAPAPSPAAADPSTTVPAAPPASSIVAPVPPVPAAASTPAPPAATPAPAGNVKLDKNGLPWDERIHAGSRAMNADGTWRAKRGVSGLLVAEVEKELRAQMGNTVTFEQAPPAGTAVPTPPVPPAPGVNAAPPPPAGEELTFQAAVARIGPKMRDGTISPERFLEVVAPFGLAGLHQLNNQPHETLLEICTQLGV